VTYRVEWSGPAQRDMARLPHRVVIAVLVYVDERLAQPRRLCKPLAGGLQGIWTARNGDYRVLLRIDEDSQTIVILQVDHRAHAYRPR
jgi:mRNA interferase RelE/StbE